MSKQVELMSCNGFKLFYIREYGSDEDVTYSLRWEVRNVIGSEYHKSLNCGLEVPVEKAVSNLVFNATIDGWLTKELISGGESV